MVSITAIPPISLALGEAPTLDYAGVTVQCVGGAESTFGLASFNGSTGTKPIIIPGDSVTASVVLGPYGPSADRATLCNISRGGCGGVTGVNDAPFGFPFHVEFIGVSRMLSVVAPLPFGTLSFTGTSIDGAPLGSATPQPLTMGTRCGIRIATGAVGGGNSFTTTRAPLPVITHADPSSGPVGTSVTIAGDGFNSTSAVKFNGTKAASVTFVSATQLKATVPAAVASGSAGPIAVTNTAAPVGSATSTCNYTTTPHRRPTITSFAPTSGVIGTTVTINGKFFTDASTVKFGRLAASYKIVSARRIKAIVPKAAVPAKISVTTPVGTATSAGKFVTPT